MAQKNSGNKICIVAPVHIWDDVRVFHKEAVSLAQFGYDVSLIARTKKKQVIKGVTLIPVKTSKKFRLLRFLMLPIVLSQALSQHADIYHLHNPDTLSIGFLLKIFGKKVIYDTHENFTDKIKNKQWLPKILRRPLAKLIGFAESAFGRLFDGAIATQQEVVSRLGSKAVLIQNPPRSNPQLIQKVRRLKTEIKDTSSGFRVIYIGTISENRGLYTMVDAMEYVNKDLNVRLWLIGKVQKEKIVKARRKKGWKYVDYIEPLPQEEAFAYVAKSDLGLIVLNLTSGYQYTDPNKIYEYMTFGVPFIASNFEMWMNRFSNIDTGWFVEPASPVSLAETIRKALSDKEKLHLYKKNALKFIENYNWEKESAKLLRLYHKVKPIKSTTDTT